MEAATAIRASGQVAGTGNNDGDDATAELAALLLVVPVLSVDVFLNEVFSLVSFFVVVLPELGIVVRDGTVTRWIVSVKNGNEDAN
jgi:hypothetical protein